MTPWMKRVHNNSTKLVHIYASPPGPGSQGFPLKYGETKIINAYISSTDEYSEINIQDPDFKAYRLKYNNNDIIALNDVTGKSFHVPDSELHVKDDSGYVNINVNYNDITLWGRDDQLGISEGGTINYYTMVTATRKVGGGLILKGFKPRGEEVVEENNNLMKCSLADDETSTQITSKTD